MEKRKILSEIGMKKYRVPVQGSEKGVETYIDNYDVSEISHPVFVKEYLWSMLEMVESMDFVSGAYIANNGLLRVNIKGEEDGYSNDIPVHCEDGRIFVLRSQREGYREYENKILRGIKERTEYLTETLKKGDFYHAKKLQDITQRFEE